MMSFLLLLFFLAGTLLFGFVISAYFLKERRIFVFAAFVPVLGINGYVFFVNLVSYLIPVRLTFWLVLLAMFAASLAMYARLRNRGESSPATSDLSSRQLRALFAAAVIVSLLSGIVALRTLMPDDLFPGHLPLVSTISQGNFPVMDPSEPDYPMAYHYGPDLLAAALQNVAGIPGWLGYDIQTILFSGTTLLAAFVLAFHLTASFRTSFIAALLLLYGGGLTWLNLFQGIAPLWRKFVLGGEVFAPWKFLASSAIPNFDSSVVTSLNHTIIIGVPVMLLAIYFYFLALDTRGQRRMSLAVFAGLLFGYLALVLETNFVILLIAFLAALAYGLQRFLNRSSFSPRVGILAPTAMAIGIGIVLAFTQGGFLSTLGTSGEGQSFVLAGNFWTSDITDKGVLPFRMKFFREFGLPLLLFIPAVIFYRRDKRILFLTLVAAGAFAAPLVIHYLPSPQNMERLFGLATPLFSFIAGLAIGEWSSRLGSSMKIAYVKIIVIAVIGMMVATAVLFQMVHMVTPVGYIGKLNRPFFDIPPAPTPIDQKAYGWIARNTTIRDRFFPYSQDFMRDTGRFTPGDGPFEWGKHVASIYHEALDSCSPSAFEKLGIAYLYGSPDFPIKNFESNCLTKLGAVPVYRDEQDGDWRRIYRLPLSP